MAKMKPPRVTAIRYQTFAQWPKRPEYSPRPGVSTMARHCPVFQQALGLGWWIFPPFDATVVWRGGCRFDVTVEDTLGANLWPEVMREIHGWPSAWWCSKIPGVLQVDPGLIFATPPNWKLLLTAPINRPASRFWTQSGLLDSDWFKIPSTVNLQVWRVDEPFQLRRDDPIAQIIPIDRRSMEGREISSAELIEFPNAGREWKAYMARAYGEMSEWAHPRPFRRKLGVYRALQRRQERRLYEKGLER